MTDQYDIAIVGAGVTGTALTRTLCRYGSGIGRVVLIEKYGSVALVNSNPVNNAQTSHAGDTETNYILEHALEVKDAATALRTYVEKRNAPGLFRRTTRMVLGVGADEVRQLEDRFGEFSPHYPDLSLAGPDELRFLEPKVMEGRDPRQPVAALVSDQGYAINYQRLAECFVEDAQACHREMLDIRFNTAIAFVRKTSSGFVLETSTGPIYARVVVFAAGAYSLHFAHQLGIGKHLAILSVAGSFFSGGPLLKGKVYRVQIPGMPFAAIHGDRDVLVDNRTRFGPTTKPLPLMERHHWETFPHFMRLGWMSFKGLKSLFKILWNRQLLSYALTNWLYDVPLIGRLLFLREARKIVPTIRLKDLQRLKNAGGIRPQIVDLDTNELIMGDKTLVGDGVIFNTTPSPGASVCLANAERDAERVARMLGGNAAFDKEAFRRDHGLS